MSQPMVRRLNPAKAPAQSIETKGLENIRPERGDPEVAHRRFYPAMPFPGRLGDGHLNYGQSKRSNE